MTEPHPLQRLIWLASSYADFCKLPKEVQQAIGFALYLAQCGDKHICAKPLRGFSGAGVLEVVDNFEGNTYRCAYTVRFADAVYVLHAFQKKAKRGIGTSKRDMDLIRARLAQAHKDHA